MELKEYFKKNKVVIYRFAEALGVHYNHLHFIMTGQRRPSEELARDIELLTEGEVKVTELRAPLKIEVCPTCGKKTKKIKDGAEIGTLPVCGEICCKCGLMKKRKTSICPTCGKRRRLENFKA